MESYEWILVTDFCKYHEVPPRFIAELQEAGLVEVIAREQQDYLKAEQLSRLEKLVRFHHELDINLEGIEAIAHMLQRMEDLQRRLSLLQQRLRLYERE